MKLAALSTSRFHAPSDRRAAHSQRLALVVVIALLLMLLVWLQHSGLQNAGFITGYALYAAVIALISLHWRKAAPTWPLGKISVWLRFHIYLAYLTIVLFGLHVGFRIP